MSGGIPNSHAYACMASQNNLDIYFSSSKPHTTPNPIATSAEVRDRGSTFIANIFTARSPEEAKSCQKYVNHVLHGNKKAAHEVAAWRCMVVKPGCTGLGGPEEFQLVSGSMDDGERWAGDRTLKVMQNLGVIDAVVVVSRWFGGTLLGPSRFDHIETCTAEVCNVFKRSEELRESIITLQTLDALLDSLREELNALQQDHLNSPTDSNTQSLSLVHDPKGVEKGSSSGQESVMLAERKKRDYSSIDLVKARRLIKSRENAIKWVKDSLDDLRTSGRSDPRPIRDRSD